MKEFLIKFTIDTAIKFAVSLYEKKGQQYMLGVFKDLGLKLDKTLDAKINNTNSSIVRQELSNMLVDLAQQISRPELKRDNSD